MEGLKELIDRMNIVSFFGGDPQSIWNRLNRKVEGVKREESFCLLSRQRVLGVVASLNEMADLFLCGDLPRETRTERFLNCKADVLTVLARGVVYQSLSH